MGEPIRFRRHDTGRWIVGRVTGLAFDGSIAIRDPAGSARSLRADRDESRRPGSRGRLRRLVVSEVAVPGEHMDMLVPSAS